MSFQRFFRDRILRLAALLSSATLGGSVDFRSVLLTAGKILLTGNGYQVGRELGVADFSPELRLPVQLICNSALEEEEMFGGAAGAPRVKRSKSAGAI